MSVLDAAALQSITSPNAFLGNTFICVILSDVLAGLRACFSYVDRKPALECQFAGRSIFRLAPSNPKSILAGPKLYASVIATTDDPLGVVCDVRTEDMPSMAAQSLDRSPSVSHHDPDILVES